MSSVYDGSLVSKVIDKGLDTLGKSPKQAIWIILEKEFKLNLNELPSNIRELQENLQKFLELAMNS